MLAGADSEGSQRVALETTDSTQFPLTDRAYDAELLALVDSQVSQGTDNGGSVARAWTSIALVGALAGWVGLRMRSP